MAPKAKCTARTQLLEARLAEEAVAAICFPDSCVFLNDSYLLCSILFLFSDALLLYYQAALMADMSAKAKRLRLCQDIV
jgi:hypothetical protein